MSYNRPPMPIPNEFRDQCPLPDISRLTFYSSEILPSTFGEDIFKDPISTSPPLSCFNRTVHPVSTPPNMSNSSSSSSVETNKFYGNMFVGTQSCPVWTHPYSLWWAKEPQQYGMAVSYIEEKQKVFGPGDPPQYYFSPTNIKSFVFSSTNFSSCENIDIGFKNPKHMSIEVSMFEKSEKSKRIRFPMVQGMGFVTAIYEGLNPQIESAIGFRSLQKIGKISANITKFHVLLENNLIWSLFVYTPQTQDEIDLVKTDKQKLIPKSDLSGQDIVIQIIPSTLIDIDNLAGSYLKDCVLHSSLNTGIYSFNYTIGGVNKNNALIFAMPHHVQTFTAKLQSKKTNILVDSTVYGKLTGYTTQNFEFQVEMPLSYGLHPDSERITLLSTEYLSTIKQAAISEIESCNVDAESNLDSMYFSGKALAKYAWILYTTHYVLRDANLSNKIIEKLKIAFKKFVENKQILPLTYDTTWGGLISSGNESQDFGNSYYNDHHFHYGYHVITAAIIAIVDKELNGSNEWLSLNQEWVDTLVRDFANPSEKDTFFPVFRSFDWFGGHSWAKGLFPSGDGKDQESSSEDANSAYALKIWGNVTGNKNLENIGNLQLGIMKNSFNNYFLYCDDNNIQPSSFIKNKVAGIFFENKIDHATYFGNNIEYIQMIHAIPINPISKFIRTPSFVKEEYEQKLQPMLQTINDGWKGIIMLNIALFDAKSSYDFFSNPHFSKQYLDGGQSLTWSLTYSALLI